MHKSIDATFVVNYIGLDEENADARPKRGNGLNRRSPVKAKGKSVKIKGIYHIIYCSYICVSTLLPCQGVCSASEIPRAPLRLPWANRRLPLQGFAYGTPISQVAVKGAASLALG